MSNFLLALIASVSISVWLYSKVARHTGGNARTSIVTVMVVGVLLFGITWYVLNSLLS